MKSFKTLTFLFLLINVNVSIAQLNVDSLKQVLNDKSTHDTTKALVYEYIATEYMFTKPDEAIKYCSEGKEFSSKIGYNQGIANNSSKLAMLYQLKSDFPKALENYLLSLSIFQKIQDANGIAMSHINLAGVYQELKEYKKAEEFYLKAEKNAVETSSLEDQRAVSESLSRLYEIVDDYDNSLLYFKKYTAIKDSIFNDSKSKDIGKLEARYEMEKQQEEEQRLAKELEDKVLAEKNRRDNLQFSGIFVFVLILFAFIFMSGKFSMSEKIAEGLIFFTFLLFFEFCLVLLDPYIESLSGGEPLFKLLFNAVLAGGIFPLHAFFENTLKRKLMKK